jgi:hypothetical protein
VRTPNEDKQETGTHSLSSAEGGSVRTRIEGQRAEVTHFLSNTEGGTSEDTRENVSEEMHSPTVEHGGKDK